MTERKLPTRKLVRMAMVDPEYGKAIAFRIRAELVCCRVYDKVEKEAAKLKKAGDPMAMQHAIARAVLRREWHELCYWGGGVGPDRRRPVPRLRDRAERLRLPVRGMQEQLRCTSRELKVKWTSPSSQDELRRVVRRALEDEGLAQAEVCRRLGVSTKHLNFMLLGKSPISLAWADRILELCGARLMLTVQYAEEGEKEE